MGNANSGRRPLPTQLKIVKGNPGKRPLPKDEPEPPALETLEAPDHLSELAAVEWSRIAPILAEIRVLTQADVAMLAAYCESFATWCQAKSDLAETGTLIKDRDTIRMNPLIRVMRGALQDMVRLGLEFGMTPSARVRLSAPATGVSPADDSDSSAARRLFG